MDILKELYYGNIRLNEKAIKKGSQYQQISTEAQKIEEVFRAELTDEGKKTLDAFIHAESMLWDIEACDSFIKGYRLGVKLLLAVLLDYDTPLPQIDVE